MVDLKELQKEVHQNKLDKNFNVTDVYKELVYITDELGELIRAYRKDLPDIGEEVADIVIYLLGLSEMLGLELEDELLKKIEKNKNRKYVEEKGKLKRI